MQSQRHPLDTRFILMVIGAVALIFGGIVGYALTRDGSSERAKPRSVAAAAVTPDETTAGERRGAPSEPPATSATRDVPPAIDTGPLTPTATTESRGERVPVEDIVSGPWEVVDLGAEGTLGVAPAATTGGATKADAAGPTASPETKPAPVKSVAALAGKKTETEVPKAAAERSPVVVPVVTPRVTIVESAIATGVADREPVGADDAFEIGVERIWAWIKVKNDGPPTRVTMVWRKGDEIAFRYTLDIGTSPGWRTWSNKTLRAWDAGEWTVDVLDANGLRVDALHFEVEPAVAADAG